MALNLLLKFEPMMTVPANPVLTADGKRMIVWHNTVVYDEKGNVMGTLSSGEDMADSLVVINKKNIIEKINNATLSIPGYGREELISAHISMIMKEDIFTSGVMEFLTKDSYIRGIDAEYVKKTAMLSFSLFASFLWV